MTVQLLTTMLYEPSNVAILPENTDLNPQDILFFEKHLDRLLFSKLTLQKNLPEWHITNPTDWTRDTLEKIIRDRLSSMKSLNRLRLRLRITVPPNLHQLEISSTPLPISTDTNIMRIYIDLVPIDIEHNHIFIENKTTQRNMYDEARDRSGSLLTFESNNHQQVDILLFNSNFEITETTIANIAIQPPFSEDQSKWWTPPCSVGLLPGIMRRYLLDSGSLIEKVITIDDIKLAQKENRGIKCFNAVRREYPVEFVIR